MGLYQYVAEGHTLVQTIKGSTEKLKVVQGEAVEIADGLFSEGRLIMAGFQKIVDGVEDIVDGSEQVIVDAVKGATEIENTITGTDTPETTDAPEATEKTETAPEDTTTPAADGSEGTDIGTESNKASPTVEVTAEDDGKADITVAVTNTKKKAK